MADRTVTVELRVSEQQYMSALQRAGRETEQLGDKVKRMSADTERAYNTLGTAAVAFGAAGALALKQIADEAIGFESSFAGVVKTVKGTADELDMLGQSLRAMAKDDVPVSVNALADIAAAAGQLGIQTDSIEGFTRVIADLGVATNLAGEQGATELAQFANITQMAQGDFDRLGSTIVDLGNNLATTEADITSMALRLASAGAQAGLSEADILALAGAARSVGIEAEAGGTAFSRILIEMRNAAMDGGAALEMFASTAGVSADAFAQSFQDDAASALVTFTEGLARMEEQGLNSNTVLDELGLADIRVGNALRAAAGAGDLFREALQLGNEAWEENTALTEEAAQRYATTESQIQFARNALVDLGIELGENLLPLIQAVATGVGGMADFFADLPEPVQTTAVAFIAVATAIGLVGGATLLLLPRIAATKVALADLGVTAAGTRGALLSMSTVRFGVLAAGITFLIGRLASARSEADAFAESISGRAGEDPAAQIRALNEELREQNELASHGVSIGVGDVITIYSSDAAREAADNADAITRALTEQRAVIEETAASGMVFADHQSALNYYLEQGYDHATAFAAASMEMAQATAESAGSTGVLADILDRLRDALGLGAVGHDSWSASALAAEEAVRSLASAHDGWMTGLQASKVHLDDAAGFYADMVDPLGAYEAALADNDANMRTWAEHQAERTADTSDSWEDYAVDVDASLADVNTSLREQIEAQQEWAENFANVATRVPAEFLPELERIATDSPELLASMRDASDEELIEFVTLSSQRGTEIVNGLAAALSIMPDIGRDFGQQTADALLERLGAGVIDAADIAWAYTEALRTGVNPLLLALGGDSIPAQARALGIPVGVHRNEGGIIPEMSPGFIPGGGPNQDSLLAWLTTREYVLDRGTTERVGPDRLDMLRAGQATVVPNWMGPAPFNAGGLVDSREDAGSAGPSVMGGFGQPRDVPRPPGHRFSSYVGEPLDAQTAAAYQAVVDYVEQFGAGRPEMGSQPFARGGGGGAGGQYTAGMMRAYEQARSMGFSSIGGYRSSGSVKGSDHPRHRAWDFMLPGGIDQPGPGWRLANWHIANSADVGTKYLIFSDMINTGGGWRGYTHPSDRARQNATLRHLDHLHASYFNAGGLVFDQGGLLPPGMSTVFNGTGQAEVIAPGGLNDLVHALGDVGDVAAALERLVDNIEKGGPGGFDTGFAPGQLADMIQEFINNVPTVGVVSVPELAGSIAELISFDPDFFPPGSFVPGPAAPAVPIGGPLHTGDLDALLAGTTGGAGAFISDPERAANAADLAAEIAQNMAEAAYEALSLEGKLAHVTDEMAKVVPWSDAWVALQAQAVDLQGQIADRAADVTAEIERQAEAQRDAAEQAQREAEAVQADLDRLLDQRDRLQQQAAQATSAYATAVANAQTRAANEIDRMIAGRQQALFGFASIDQRFSPAWGNTAGALTDNILDQVAAFDEWADGLAGLRARGLDEGLISALRLDDPAQLGQVRMLTHATDVELAALARAYESRTTQAADRAEEESTLLLGALGRSIIEVRATLDDTLAGLRDDLTVRLADIGAEMQAIGTDTGRSFADSLAEGLASGIPGVVAAAEELAAAAARAVAAAGAATGGSTSMPTLVGNIDQMLPGVTPGNQGGFTSQQLRTMQAAPPQSGLPFQSELMLVVEGTPMRAFVRSVSRDTAMLSRIEGRVSA